MTTQSSAPVLAGFDIHAVPAVINYDIEALNARADAYLEKYTGYVVTEENLAEDKKLAQELGRDATTLNRRRIDLVKELSEPVTGLANDLNGVRDKFLDAQALINDQVKAFEAERLAEIGETIKAYFAGQVAEKGIREEYADFAEVCERLTMLSALTTRGNLTAKTSREAEAALSEALNRQNTTDLRLARLEAECRRLDLSAPLTEAHVKHILHLGDEEYQSGLEKIIAAELEREKEALARHRAKMEREAEIKARAEAQAQVRAEEAHKRGLEQEEQAKKQAEQNLQEQQEQQSGPDEPPVAVVTCTFRVPADSSVPSEYIEKLFRERLAKAEFTTLTNISITRQ